MAEVIVNNIKVLFTGESKSLEEASQKAEASLSGFSKAAKKHSNFLGKIGKILEYRFIRGGISNIMKGLEEGKKAIEAYDKSLNGLSASRAATFMKEMAENATLLKNTFASLFMTIYAAAKPAIDFLVEALQTAMNALNQFISALLGRTQYTKAVKGINSVTSAAKELKKQIFGFDELNILNAPTGAGQEDFAKNFEEADIAKPFLEIAKAVEQIKSKLPFDDLLKTAGLIGVAIAGWKVGSTLLQFMSFIKSPDAQFTVGVGLVITGIVGFLDALSKVVTEGMNENTIYELMLSSGAIILGGAMIGRALGNSMMGATIGVIAASGLALYTVITDAIHNGLSPVEAALIPILSGIVTGALLSLTKVVSFGVGGLIGIAMGLIADFAIWVYQNRDEIVKKLKEGAEMVKNNWATFKEEFVVGWHDFVSSIGEYLKKKKEEFKKSWEEFWNSPFEWVKQKFEQIFGWIDRVKSFNFSDAIEKGRQAAERALEITRSMGVDPIKGYASGGFPQSGDLFIANEQAPELIGSFGNRTGVYNQEQFGAAMAAANQEVVQAVLAIGSQITGAVNNKPVPSVKIGDRDIFNASQRGANLVGNSLIQGGRA